MPSSIHASQHFPDLLSITYGQENQSPRKPQIVIQSESEQVLHYLFTGFILLLKTHRVVTHCCTMVISDISSSYAEGRETSSTKHGKGKSSSTLTIWYFNVVVHHTTIPVCVASRDWSHMRKIFTGMDGFRTDRENTENNATQQHVKKARKKSKYMYWDLTWSTNLSKVNGKDQSYL